MASYMSVFMILAIAFPAFASATEFVVGDDKGWTVSIDYQAWATDKDFQVGDTLVFKYPEGAHNVLKVNETEFQNCIIRPGSEALTSGNDKIVLESLGKKGYICGVNKHCKAGGQKLLITVQPPQLAPAIPPSQPHPSSANSIAFHFLHLVTLLSLALWV